MYPYLQSFSIRLPHPTLFVLSHSNQAAAVLARPDLLQGLLSLLCTTELAELSE